MPGIYQSTRSFFDISAKCRGIYIRGISACTIAALENITFVRALKCLVHFYEVFRTLNGKSLLKRSILKLQQKTTTRYLEPRYTCM